MLAPRHKLFLWVVSLLAINWLTLTPVGVNDFVPVTFCYFFGSLFGHATLAAAWAAFGPGSFAWRIPLSLVWVLMLVVPIIMITQGPSQDRINFTILFFGAWLVSQIPLWGLKTAFRFELRHTDERKTFDPSQRQFGIRQLIVATAIVGVALGIGRLLIANVPQDFSPMQGEIVVFVYLQVIVAIFSIPLLLASLLERGALIGASLVLAMISLGTYFEEPILLSFVAWGPNSIFYELIGINAFACGLHLVVAATVRRCGYRLIRLRTATTKPA